MTAAALMDNKPKHTAKTTQQFLKLKKIDSSIDK